VIGSLLLAGSAASLLTVEGIWTAARMKEPQAELEQVAIKSQTEKICVVFPCYKDVVDIKKWLAWGDEWTRFVIVEDVHNGNILMDPRRVVILKRDNRNGFKAGALNHALNYLVDLHEKDPSYCFDYVMFFDADHIPLEPLWKIQAELRKTKGVVAQFFWYDGLPLRGPLDWLTFSARYYSNYNIYNRRNGFPNLTGSAMAVPFDLVLQGLRFPESITEDYALTLMLKHAEIPVQVIPLVISIGRSPRNFREFVRQQERWAEGTVRDAIDHMYILKRIGWKARADFFLQANMYAQGVWIVISAIALFLLSVGIDYIALSLMAVQLVTYLATLRQAPKKYWPVYVVLNYIMIPFQVYACLKGVWKTNGRFYRTPKSGGA
jgi:cellulose synthase/poly-beta-1,6-N-acetylglucosamine synthase-like glycosyltransferase